MECSNIAERFFSKQEFQFIQSLTEEEKIPVFFHLWTVKEAYLKATGEGLGGGLDSIEVDITQPFGNDKIKIKRRIKDRTNGENNNWFFSSFILQENFIATVAVLLRKRCAIETKQQTIQIKNFCLN